MKLKTTIYLILAVLIFASYILFFEKYSPPTVEVEKQKNKPFSISLENIKKITINNNLSGEKVTVSKDDDSEGWSIISPLHVEGDPEKIEEIVQRLHTLKSTRTLSGSNKNPLKIDDFELKNPKVEILVLANDKSTAISIGKNTPLGDNMYIMVNHDSTNIHIIPNNLLLVLNRKVDELRNTKVTRFIPGKMIKLEIQTPEKNITYIKKEDGWYLPDPYIYRADENSINLLLANLSELKIVKFIDNDVNLLTQYGLGEKKRIEITVYETRKKIKKILFGEIVNEDEGWGYVKAYEKNYVYLASHALLSFLPEKVDDWRDAKVIRFDQEKLNKLQLRYKNKKLFFTKQDNGWTINEPVNMPADEIKINEVLQKLAGLETEDFISEKKEDISKYGLNEPESEISLYYKGIDTPLSLLAGKRADTKDKLYLKNTKEDTIFRVTLGILDSIFQDYIEYKDHTLWDIPQEQIIEIDLTKENKTKKIIYGENKQWMIDKRMVDPTLVYILTSELSKPRAIKYVTLKMDSSAIYGLDNPQISVSFTLSDKTSPFKLLIGNKTKFMTYYAKIEGRDEIFLIGKNFYNALVQKY